MAARLTSGTSEPPMPALPLQEAWRSLLPSFGEAHAASSVSEAPSAWELPVPWQEVLDCWDRLPLALVSPYSFAAR